MTQTEIDAEFAEHYGHPAQPWPPVGCVVCGHDDDHTHEWCTDCGRFDVEFCGDSTLCDKCFGARMFSKDDGNFVAGFTVALGFTASLVGALMWLF